MLGRFISPDGFTGGPDELFDFTGAAAENPTLYADITHPQSLNKYQYCYNNPLNYIDPNGHQQALTQRLMLERGRNPAGSAARTAGATADTPTDVITGVGMGLANVGIGVNNLMAAYKVAGAQYVEPYEGKNKTQQAAQIVTEDLTLFAGLLGGKPRWVELLLQRPRRQPSRPQKLATRQAKAHEHCRQQRWRKV